MLEKLIWERAFERARSGKCFDISELNKQLKSERFDPIYSEGAALKSNYFQKHQGNTEEGTKQRSQH
jgi:hypothetical protein